MRIIPTWLREFVNVPVDDRQLAEDLTSVGIAVESVGEEQGAMIYEMDLTTNRVDAMNHYGVAREASAIYDVELKKIEPKLRRTTAGLPGPAVERSLVGMTNDEVFPIFIEDANGADAITVLCELLRYLGGASFRSL